MVKWHANEVLNFKQTNLRIFLENLCCSKQGAWLFFFCANASVKPASAQPGAVGKDLQIWDKKLKAATLSEMHREAVFKTCTYRQAKLTSPWPSWNSQQWPWNSNIPLCSQFTGLFRRLLSETKDILQARGSGNFQILVDCLRRTWLMQS